MGKFLAQWVKIKKDKHGKHCYDQRKHFSPFSLLVAGMMGKDALFVLETMSQLMAAEMDETILNIKVWFNRRIAIAVTRSYSSVLRGS